MDVSVRVYCVCARGCACVCTLICSHNAIIAYTTTKPSTNITSEHFILMAKHYIPLVLFVHKEKSVVYVCIMHIALSHTVHPLRCGKCTRTQKYILRARRAHKLTLTLFHINQIYGHCPAKEKCTMTRTSIRSLARSLIHSIRLHLHRNARK